jgi:hypothetical protein
VTHPARPFWRRVRFRLSGGYAGLVRGADIALDQLAPAERARLQELIARSGLADPPHPPRGGEAAARDARHIDLELESDQGIAAHSLSELELPAAAAPLVAWLEEHAQPLRVGRGRDAPG